jgi:hypothetical protein
MNQLQELRPMMRTDIHLPMTGIGLASLVYFISCLGLGNVSGQTFKKEVHPRIVITADPELDDNNSLIRFLLYSSDLEVEALVYVSSG